MKIGIVGLGLIGGSIAVDLRATGLATHLIGVESNANHCHQSMDRRLVDEIMPLEIAVRAVECVIIATPVGAITQILPLVLDCVAAQTTVTDMGSTKSEIVASVQSHRNRRQFVAAHPMAGTEFSGPLAAIAGLFAGRTAVICDAQDSGLEHVNRIEQIFSALRMRLVRMSSQEHDLHAAFVSHLSHVSSFVLANTVLDKERDTNNIFNLAGGGFESTVRLAKSSPEMWTPIFSQNRNNVLEALESYISHLHEFASVIRNSDSAKMKEIMTRANEIGRVLQSVSQRQSAKSKGGSNES